MSWILLATLGQFLNAVVAFLDKYIVSDERALPRPFVYAFYSCLLTGGWVFIYLLGLLPGLTERGLPSFENIHKPTIQVIGMSFLAAYTFFMALVSMYDALRKAEAVSVMPVVGAISAIATLGMSYLFLGNEIANNFIFGVVFLAFGTALVAQALPNRNTIITVIHSGLFFALHYITMKGLFQETNFDDGFFWSRVGFVLFALSLLLVPTYLEKIREQTGGTTKRTGLLVLIAKILAGVAAFLMLKATDLGDVAVVQALDGLKFVFILIITFLLGSFLPNSTVREEKRPHEVFKRILYVTIITIGFFVLFI